MKMLPGLGKMAKQIEEANLDDTILKRHEAIILSMTKAEREKPALLNASRKKRIAAGAGTTVQEINKICKQQQQMAAVMKKIKKMGMGGMMKQMKSLMGGKGEELELMAQSMDPDNLGRDMAALKGNDILGANPFDGAGAPSGLPGLGGGMPGLAGLGGGQMGGMPGMPTRGGTKKNRKPKVKKGKRK